jgi:hypothetical protein
VSTPPSTTSPSPPTWARHRIPGPERRRDVHHARHRRPHPAHARHRTRPRPPLRRPAEPRTRSRSPPGRVRTARRPHWTRSPHPCHEDVGRRPRPAVCTIGFRHVSRTAGPRARARTFGTSRCDARYGRPCNRRAATPPDIHRRHRRGLPDTALVVARTLTCPTHQSNIRPEPSGCGYRPRREPGYGRRMRDGVPLPGRTPGQVLFQLAHRVFGPLQPSRTKIPRSRSEISSVQCGQPDPVSGRGAAVRASVMLYLPAARNGGRHRHGPAFLTLAEQRSNP